MDPIFYDSPEAASIKTVTGWVARTGEYCGNNEHMARWCGCTHKRCETEGCQSILERSDFTICSECRHKKSLAKYEARPRAAWDGVSMLYSDACDEYFSDPEEALDFAEDHYKSLADLRLIICVPNRLSAIYEDHWHDELPEDGELPDGVAIALESLNEAIAESGPSSWEPGEFALGLLEGNESGTLTDRGSSLNIDCRLAAELAKSKYKCIYEILDRISAHIFPWPKPKE
jgi:hypothetical protein